MADQDVWCAGLTRAAFHWDLTFEEQLLAAFSEVAHWGYAWTDTMVRFPRMRAGLPASRVVEDPRRYHHINCSSLTAYLLFTVYPSWDSTAYGDLQIFDMDRPWSPIDAVARCDAGEVEDSFDVGQWYLLQTWTRLGTDRPRGHARIVKCLSSRGELWALEANRGGDALPGVRAVALEPLHETADFQYRIARLLQ